jgi:hypothetical protein
MIIIFSCHISDHNIIVEGEQHGIRCENIEVCKPSGIRQDAARAQKAEKG